MPTDYEDKSPYPNPIQNLPLGSIWIHDVMISWKQAFRHHRRRRLNLLVLLPRRLNLHLVLHTPPSSLILVIRIDDEIVTLRRPFPDFVSDSDQA